MKGPRLRAERWTERDMERMARVTRGDLEEAKRWGERYADPDLLARGVHAELSDPRDKLPGLTGAGPPFPHLWNSTSVELRTGVSEGQRRE